MPLSHEDLTAHAAATKDFPLLAECAMISSLDMLHELQQHPQPSLSRAAHLLSGAASRLANTAPAPNTAPGR